MMVRKPRTQSTQVRQHLKYVGLKAVTLARYKTAVSRYFEWLRLSENPRPRTYAEVEHATAEFINFLYQDERPLSWASTFLSGFRRLCPTLRSCLTTAALYTRNWSDSVERVKAFPYSVHMLQAMATLLWLEKKPHYAVLVLTAFSGLFRLGELFKLKVKFVEIAAPNFCIVSLTHTKAKRGTECVVIRDETVIRLLQWCIKGRGPEELIFKKCSYRVLGNWLRKFAAWLEVAGDRFTGHGFRRGGATHFFKLYRAYDRVQQLGRWADARVARSYIDSAIADRLLLVLSTKGAQVLQDGIAGFPLAMSQLLKSA
jgi:integrase